MYTSKVSHGISPWVIVQPPGPSTRILGWVIIVQHESVGMSKQATVRIPHKGWDEERTMGRRRGNKRKSSPLLRQGHDSVLSSSIAVKWWEGNREWGIEGAYLACLRLRVIIFSVSPTASRPRRYLALFCFASEAVRGLRAVASARGKTARQQQGECGKRCRAPNRVPASSRTASSAGLHFCCISVSQVIFFCVLGHMT